MAIEKGLNSMYLRANTLRSKIYASLANSKIKSSALHLRRTCRTASLCTRSRGNAYLPGREPRTLKRLSAAGMDRSGPGDDLSRTLRPQLGIRTAIAIS
jgi:hypothetical protein